MIASLHAWLSFVAHSFVHVKFIYSEKATKFCEISTNYLSYVCKVQRADLTCDVIKKVAPFVLSKL